MASVWPANESQNRSDDGPREASAVPGVYRIRDQHGLRSEEKVRSAVFQPYQLNVELMSLAAPDAVFMHVFRHTVGAKLRRKFSTGPNRWSSTNPKNRMYVQKAILHTLF